MKIQIEKQIEVHTDRNHEGLNAIIEAALTCTRPSGIRELLDAVKEDDRISKLDFFLYAGGSHVAVHEILPNGYKSERLLLITED